VAVGRGVAVTGLVVGVPLGELVDMAWVEGGVCGGVPHALRSIRQPATIRRQRLFIDDPCLVILEAAFPPIELIMVLSTLFFNDRNVKYLKTKTLTGCQRIYNSPHSCSPGYVVSVNFL